MTNEIVKKSDSMAPFQITTFDEAMRLAKAIANSDLAPKDFRGKPDNVLVAIQMGNELGLKPMQAIQNIAVVNGRPTVWGDAALALVRGNPECEYVKEWMDGTIKGGDAIAYCEVKRGKEIIKREFSVKQATQASLIDKGGVWKQYPERMLQMRARGFALRDSFPDVLKGVYIEGEMDVAIIENEVIEQPKEAPKLGVQAVKNAIIQTVNTMKENVVKEAEAANINQETGEVIEYQDSEMPTFAEFADVLKCNIRFADILKYLQEAKTVEELIMAKDIARSIPLNDQQKKIINEKYLEKQKEVK